MVGGPTRFARSSTSSVLLWRAHVNGDLFRSHTGLSPSVVGLSRPLCWERFCQTPQCFRNPGTNPGLGSSPLSLAATHGIDVSFFSSRYLDVSVPWVRSDNLAIQLPVTAGYAAEFPHSDILGSTLVCQLPEAYRRLPRLSSPLDAKTSTLHP